MHCNNLRVGVPPSEVSYKVPPQVPKENCNCHQLHVSWSLGVNWRPLRSEDFLLSLLKWSNADFAPQNYEAIQTLPATSRTLHTLSHKITEPSYFAPQNDEAMQTSPRKTRET